MELAYERARDPLFLRVLWTRRPALPASEQARHTARSAARGQQIFAQQSSGPADAPTKLALGVEGGFQLDQPVRAVFRGRRAERESTAAGL